MNGMLLHHLSVPGTNGPSIVLLHGSGQTELTLLPFARDVAPGSSIVAVRGRVAWEGGYAHFRRNPDRTLDQADLAIGAAALCTLLRSLRSDGTSVPVLLGYSNGAIVAAAALQFDPSLVSGAILLRPLSPTSSAIFPDLGQLPILLVSADHDERRAAGDDAALAVQLRQAGAELTFERHDGSHGLSATDTVIVRTWIKDCFPENPDETEADERRIAAAVMRTAAT